MLLQACPDCGRQYDVRHLEPGRRVHCACEREFQVERPRELRVAARNCANCGGPVAATDGACPYCSAGLDAVDRSSMPCPACFARIDESARHCQACGIAILPQSLPPIPAGVHCPRCKGRLEIRALATFALVECAQCRGIWIDPEAFRALCSDAERAAAGIPFAPAPPAAASTSAEAPRGRGPHYIPCLDCGELMIRRQYLHRDRSTGVVLDVCREHGLWLDGSELADILKSIKRHGAEPRPPARDEARAVHAALSWSERSESRGLSLESALGAFRDLLRRAL